MTEEQNNPTPPSKLVVSDPPLDWSNFEGLKRNVKWIPDDQDLIYTAINFRDDEWGDIDEDAGQQIVERLLAAWKASINAVKRPPNASQKAIDFLYKHGDLTYSACQKAISLLLANGFALSATATEGGVDPCQPAADDAT